MQPFRIPAGRRPKSGSDHLNNCGVNFAGYGTHLILLDFRKSQVWIVLHLFLNRRNTQVLWTRRSEKHWT